MKISNRLQLGLGAAAACVVAVVLVVLVGPASIAPPIVLVPDVRPSVIQIAPTLDTFRVEPDGSTVMAGRAAPLAIVDIMVNGARIDQVTADRQGGFVAFPQIGFSDVSRAISLLSGGQNTVVQSQETYLISPLPAPVANNLATRIVTRPAPAVIVASDAGLRVVQPGISDAAPQVVSSVALDSITYNPGGDVVIAGRAAGDGSVQIYVDNQPVNTSQIAVDGNWQADLPDVVSGIYTLRVDEISPIGSVVSRIETPFQREAAAVVAQAFGTQTQAAGFQVAMTTVQPGTTLWAIAQDRFGDGVLYFKVFEANRDRIRDPDLIYPGQVFRIPQDD